MFLLKSQDPANVSIGRLVYIDRPPLTTLNPDRNSDKYNNLLSGAYGLLKLLDVTQKTLSIDNNFWAV